MLPPNVCFEMQDGKLQALLTRDDRALSKFQGLGRSLVANAVAGVSQGFKKELDIVGIGYRAEVSGKRVTFALGYSHPVLFDLPEGIKVDIDNQTHLVVSGADRQKVGQVAADIRSLRKPDPYKQKGIRYTGEMLKKKVGKTGA
jgi:large subunit ribosomal protein L6